MAFGATKRLEFCTQVYFLTGFLHIEYNIDSVSSFWVYCHSKLEIIPGLKEAWYQTVYITDIMSIIQRPELNHLLQERRGWLRQYKLGRTTYVAYDQV